MTAPASTWDHWNATMAPRYPHNKLIQFMLRRYREGRDRLDVLDLGCGNGVNSVFLAEQGFRVSLSDISPVGVSHALGQLEGRGLRAMGHRVESIADCSFPDGSFDCIVSIGVLDSAGPLASTAALRHAARCLRAGGVGFFLFAADDDSRMEGNPFGLHGYSTDEVRGMFSAAGFSRFTVDHYKTTFDNESTLQHDYIVVAYK